MSNIDQLITKIHALKTQDITCLFHDIKLVLSSGNTQAVNRLSSVSIEFNGQQHNLISLYVEQGKNLAEKLTRIKGILSSKKARAIETLQSVQINDGNPACALTWYLENAGYDVETPEDKRQKNRKFIKDILSAQSIIATDILTKTDFINPPAHGDNLFVFYVLTADNTLAAQEKAIEEIIASQSATGLNSLFDDPFCRDVLLYQINDRLRNRLLLSRTRLSPENKKQLSESYLEQPVKRTIHMPATITQTPTLTHVEEVNAEIEKAASILRSISPTSVEASLPTVFSPDRFFNKRSSDELDQENSDMKRTKNQQDTPAPR